MKYIGFQTIWVDRSMIFKPKHFWLKSSLHSDENKTSEGLRNPRKWFKYFANFIPFFMCEKCYFWIMSVKRSVYLISASVCSEILMFELARCSENPWICCLDPLDVRNFFVNKANWEETCKFCIWYVKLD